MSCLYTLGTSLRTSSPIRTGDKVEPLWKGYTHLSRTALRAVGRITWLDYLAVRYKLLSSAYKSCPEWGLGRGIDSLVLKVPLDIAYVSVSPFSEISGP